MLDDGWHEWFATLIVFAEILVGLALILGALTGLAAFGGWFMNVNLMLAGAASTNQVMATMAAMLMISYAVAGHVGLDRWLLPRRGTPWGRRRRSPSSIGWRGSRFSSSTPPCRSASAPWRGKSSSPPTS